MTDQGLKPTEAISCHRQFVEFEKGPGVAMVPDCAH